MAGMIHDSPILPDSEMCISPDANGAVLAVLLLIGFAFLFLVLYFELR
jgi:hypothetical protein